MKALVGKTLDSGLKSSNNSVYGRLFIANICEMVLKRATCFDVCNLSNSSLVRKYLYRIIYNGASIEC